MMIFLIIVTLIIIPISEGVKIGLKSDDDSESELDNFGRCFNGGFTGLRLPVNTSETDPFSSNLLICFDVKYDTTLFTRHTMYKIPENFTDCSLNTTYAHAEWRTGPFFSDDDYDVNDCYKHLFQNVTMGLRFGGHSHLNIDNGLWLDKGQLIPSCDLSGNNELELNATFKYVNVVPIWNSVLTGNLQEIEKAIRQLVSDTTTNFTIYSGTYGTLQLNNTKPSPVRTYLGRDKFGQLINKLPVPRLIWKVVYHEATHSGLVIILINNPYVESTILNSTRQNEGRTSSESGLYMLCPSICNQIKWIDWKNINANNVTSGYIYCCEIGEFSIKVHYLYDYIDLQRNISLLRENRLIGDQMDNIGVREHLPFNNILALTVFMSFILF